MNTTSRSIEMVPLGAALAMLLALPPPLSADPPPWAPAWGYRDKSHGKGRDKHKGGHDEYAEYERRGEAIGIADGHCNREQIGAIAGAALGGAIGSRVGDGDGRTVAIVAGTLIGLVVGSNLGRWMDETDQQCIGQTLERAPDGHTVTWRNPETGARLQATPVGTWQQGDRYCRDYRTVIETASGDERRSGRACRDGDGVWNPVPG